MSKNILIVDDDKRLRELLKDYLTEKNLQVYQGEDYNEAKEILSLVLFDLIILDRMMPSGDGIELIEFIKKLSNTPVIMLTAMGEDKRTKKSILSKKGQELEQRLSEIQIKKIRNVLLKFNEIDINGFKKILYEMVDDKNKEKFDEINR